MTYNSLVFNATINILCCLLKFNFNYCGIRGTKQFRMCCYRKLYGDDIVDFPIAAHPVRFYSLLTESWRVHIQKIYIEFAHFPAHSL